MFAINHHRFFEGYHRAFGPLTHSEDAGLETLLASIERDDAFTEDDICPIAYILATVKHECANTWEPITEYGSRAYFDKYEPATLLGQRLGNTLPGDGWLFRGRGYVQITGRANYGRVTDEFDNPNMNLIGNPTLALEPPIAYKILSMGMRAGWFTGKELSEYCAGRESDYVGARRVVNGVDQCHTIASYASTFEGILLAATEPDPSDDEGVAIPTLSPPVPPQQAPRPGFWRRLIGLAVLLTVAAPAYGQPGCRSRVLPEPSPDAWFIPTGLLGAEIVYAPPPTDEEPYGHLHYPFHYVYPDRAMNVGLMYFTAEVPSWYGDTMRRWAGLAGYGLVPTTRYVWTTTGPALWKDRGIVFEGYHILDQALGLNGEENTWAFRATQHFGEEHAGPLSIVLQRGESWTVAVNNIRYRGLTVLTHIQLHLRECYLPGTEPGGR